MNADASAILALLLLPGIGNAAVHRALAASSVLGMRLSDMLDVNPRDLARKLPAGLHNIAGLVTRCSPAEHARARDLLDAVTACDGDAITPADPGWPASLARLGTAVPPIVFIRGERDILNKPAAAVVGARDPSNAGARLAADCAAFYAGQGIAVVSGGARGVDTRAHIGAIDAGGETIVVLPQGILTYDPPPPIARAVDEGRAVILSQFQPDSAWQTHAAVSRNATIAALARVMCVVEPRKTGGSIRAARVAVSLGKPVAAWCSTNQVRRLLETVGARKLAGQSGKFQREYVQNLWLQNTSAAPIQTDLLNYST